MNTPWWILAAVGGFLMLAVLPELIISARRRFARHPEQHEHVPGEWQ